MHTEEECKPWPLLVNKQGGSSMESDEIQNIVTISKACNKTAKQKSCPLCVNAGSNAFKRCPVRTAAWFKCQKIEIFARRQKEARFQCSRYCVYARKCKLLPFRMTSPCSLNRSTPFCKIGKMGGGKTQKWNTYFEDHGSGAPFVKPMVLRPEPKEVSPYPLPGGSRQKGGPEIWLRTFVTAYRHWFHFPYSTFKFI